jgi:hypothetical protein
VLGADQPLATAATCADGKTGDWQVRPGSKSNDIIALAGFGRSWRASAAMLSIKPINAGA